VVGAGSTGLVCAIHLALGVSLRREMLLLARRMTGSIEAFGMDVFDGATRPTAWLAGSAQHSGLAPSTAGSGAFGFLLVLLAHASGWPFPEGGQQRITDALIEAQLERFAPGFTGTVLARAIRNPAQTESDNPSLVGGDLGGGTYELDQQLIFRPAPELCRHRTPLKGLYVTGASVHPGGSVQGMGGRSAARALLADRRLRPWRA
jgi:phytoene dehydrogenase-like protein